VWCWRPFKNSHCNGATATAPPPDCATTVLLVGAGCRVPGACYCDFSVALAAVYELVSWARSNHDFRAGAFRADTDRGCVAWSCPVRAAVRRIEAPIPGLRWSTEVGGGSDEQQSFSANIDEDSISGRESSPHFVA
jgi:hypothetical protein